MFDHPLELLDLLIVSLVVGATVWFFFIQSPALIRSMGRDRFVPLQMRLTKLLFAVLMYATLAVLGLSLVLAPALGPVLAGAAVAALAAAFSHLYVIPRALRAGGKGRVEARKAGDDGSVASFAVEGSGPSARFWHQMVVAFVVVILGAMVVHVGGVLGL